MGRKMLVKRGVCASRWAPTTVRTRRNEWRREKRLSLRTQQRVVMRKTGFTVKWRPRESLFLPAGMRLSKRTTFNPPPCILLIAFNRTSRGGGCSICTSITVLIFVLDRSHAHACFESRQTVNNILQGSHKLIDTHVVH